MDLRQQTFVIQGTKAGQLVANEGAVWPRSPTPANDLILRFVNGIEVHVGSPQFDPLKEFERNPFVKKDTTIIGQIDGDASPGRFVSVNLDLSLELAATSGPTPIANFMLGGVDLRSPACTFDIPKQEPAKMRACPQGERFHDETYCRDCGAMVDFQRNVIRLREQGKA